MAGIIDRLICLTGRHDPVPHAMLTRASREFRCRHCAARFVDMQEHYVGPMLRGRVPFHQGRTPQAAGIGDLLAEQGIRDGIDQTPFAHA